MTSTDFAPARAGGPPAIGRAGPSALPPGVEALMKDQRKHRRVAIALGARFVGSDLREADGTILDISAGGLALASDVTPPLGDQVVVYVDGIGRLEGEVVRHLADGFALRFAYGDRKRERIVEKITWESNRHALGLEEERRHARVNAMQHTRAILPDGTDVPCTVLDMSLSGLSLELAIRPAVGEEVRVGRMKGRVVRHHDRGVGIEFSATPVAGSLATRLTA